MWGAAIVPGARSSGAAENTSPSQASAEIADQGSFTLNQAGHEYGTEKFSIQTIEGKIQAQGETQLREGEGRHATIIKTFSKLTLNSALEPQNYTWSALGPEKYDLRIDFTPALATCLLHRPNGKDDIREFQLPKDVVVLDNNVIHHYQLLVDRYHRTPGGKQAFNAFIPQAATPGALTVQDAGLETINLVGRQQSLRHLVVLTDNAEIDLWEDGQGRLQRLYWSAPQVEALRQP